MRPSAIETPSTDPQNSQVVEALEATRRGMSRYRLGRSVLGLLFAGLGLTTVLVALDLNWVLSSPTRAVGLIVLATLVLAGAARIALATGPRYGRGDAAIEVESAFPELGQRVRTTLEYAEPGAETAPASRSLVVALAADTDRKAQGLEFPALVPWSRFKLRAFMLAAVVCGILVAVTQDPEVRIAVQRVFLSPAHYTTIEVKPGDQTIKAGTDLELNVMISGRAVPSAEWRRRPSGGQGLWTSNPLGTSGKKPVSGLVKDLARACQEDFDYQVVAGELESDVFHVKVTHPLVLKSIEAAIQPPTYTRRPSTVVKEGNFTALEGSRVRFKVALDRPTSSARLTWKTGDGGPSKTIPLKVEGLVLKGELALLARDVRYEITAIAEDGMKLEPLAFLIKVRADAKPTIQFVKPTESFAATATTEVPVKVNAGDDFGIARVGIAFQVNDRPEESLYLVEPIGQANSVEALTTLYLENHKLTCADSVSYRAFVEDNRPDHPQRVNTELRFLDILPYKQAYAMAESGDAGGASGGTSLTLEELIARQRLNLSRTFAHSQEPTIDSKVAERLSKAEAELAKATQEFAGGLASEFEPVSPLEQASRAMISAMVTLSEKDFPNSVILEKRALDSLIQARQNLRKLLSDSPSKSAAECKKFDRQQEQKLRIPPRAEPKPRESELARLEQDVQELAEEQKRFAEEIDPKGGGGPELDKKNEPKAPPPAQPSNPKPGPASRQASASKEADRLKELARLDQALTPSAQARMDAATQTIKDAEASIQHEKPEEAADAARKAAEQLDRLAAQIAGLKAKDLGDRIARARELAQTTARAERELAGQVKAAPTQEQTARQAGLTDQVEALADVLKKLASDAVEEDRNLVRELAQATEVNAPSEIERAMRAAGDRLASGEGLKAAQGMEGAAKQLEVLAVDLETARRGYVQPQLEQLLAAERKAAEVSRILNSVKNSRAQAEAERALAELSKTMDSLKSAEGPVQQAAEALAQATRSGSSTVWARPPTETSKLQDGLFTPPSSYEHAVGAVAKALQARIQELILKEALVDRDGAVPPGYKELVQDYFRVLSEDLR